MYDGERHFNKEFTAEGESEGRGILTEHTAAVLSHPEIADAGEAENQLVVAVSDEAGADVTKNYDAEYIYGTLSVTPRPVRIQTASETWVYDGERHFNKEFTAEGESEGRGILTEHKVGVISHTEIADVGEAENQLVVAVSDEVGADVTKNYNAEYIYGTLSVTPRSVHFTTGTSEDVYDGEPFFDETLLAEAATEDSGLVAWHHTQILSRTEITDVGSAENELSAAIFDGGRDVTKNYTVTYTYGALSVTPRPVTFYADGKEKVYDDKPYTGPFTLTPVSEYVPALVLDHVGSATFSVDGVDAGMYTIYISEPHVFSGEKDVTHNYSISLQNVTLSIVPRPITITTDSETWDYDGAAHSCEQFTHGEGEYLGNWYALLAGHTIVASGFPSVTNVGAAENFASFAIQKEDGAGGYLDVTRNYDIGVFYGTLKIMIPGELVIETWGAEKVYDGTPLTQPGYTVVTNTLGGEFWDSSVFDISVVCTGAITDAGNVQNFCEFSVFAEEVGAGDLTEFVHLTIEYGELVVAPRPITITTGSETWDYDGTAHKFEEWTYAAGEHNGEAYELLPGHTIDASGFVSITNVGIMENSATFRILQPNGSGGYFDVTYNYDITCIYGTLKIMIPGELVIETSGAEKVYDGTPLTYPKYTIGNALGGAFWDSSIFDISVVCTGTITDAGAVQNFCEVSVFAEEVGAGDLIEFVHLTIEYGELVVIPRPITITTGSETWEYDGEAHKFEEWACEEGEYDGEQYELLPEDIIVATDFAQITEVGSKENTVHITIQGKDAAGDRIDVTHNYTIEYELGTLKVVGKGEGGGGGSGEGGSGEGGSGEGEGGGGGEGEGEGEGGSGGGGDVAGDLDTSGELGLPLGGGAEGNAISFRVRSTYSGSAYFRLLSYGDYTGKGWEQAEAYSHLLEGGYSYNYLTGAALREAGFATASAEVEMLTGDYLLPYYLYLASDGNYAAQTSDIWYQGDTSEIYTVPYVPYEYIWDGAQVFAQGSKYYAAEQAYRKFVYENYLSVPASTRAYLQTIIAEQLFSRDDPYIVLNVAEFIQNIASYNLKYDRSLDKAEDIVVAFLLDYREGICQHYASAATLLFRTLGIPARYTIGYSAYTSEGQWVSVTPDNAHAWVEVYIDGMGWVNVEVTGSGIFVPGGSGGGGGATNLLIKPTDRIKQYDGTPLTANAFEAIGRASSETLRDLQSKGYTFYVTYEGSITQPGTATSSISSVIVYDNTGKVATDVRCRLRTGTLTVVDTVVITVHPYSLQKYYDGTPLEYGPDDYYVTGLPDGWTLDYSLEGVQLTELGTLDISRLRADSAAVYDHGELVPEEDYLIVFEGTDTLLMEKREITISTISASKQYDGTPLEDDTWWISAGSLVEGHTATVSVTATITDIGKVENRISSIVIRDENGLNVSKNYNVSFRFGTLEILPD